MNTDQQTHLYTTEDLMAMPEDGIDWEISRGELINRGPTIRGRRHATTATHILAVLSHWLDLQHKPRGEVLGVGAGFQLQRNPDTAVAIDIAYLSAETTNSVPEDAPIIDGIPVLAVEILSPSDKQQDVHGKIRDYLFAGVPLVWLADPEFKTITVYQPDAEPQMFTVKQEITAEPHLPGFRAPVAELFGG